MHKRWFLKTFPQQGLSLSRWPLPTGAAAMLSLGLASGAAAGLAGAGCAGSEAVAAPVVTAPPPPAAAPVHERGRDKLIAEVGPAGGTLELEDGARVDIPAGALDAPVEMTFSEGSHTTAFDNREHEKTLGRTLDLSPPLALGTPIRVSIPLRSFPKGFEHEHLTLATEVVSDQQRGYKMQGVATRWDYLQAATSADRVEASLDHVPGMRLQFLVSKDDD